ncbi:SDR family NAD(P)-dependent oxidoreductase [Kibdelosporangium aridum]|uniref:SDR family NAD(P)-dependent oxidoreductase n=1 Tax=Kibdelosporangium aridum TaxID=2030 RepID=A0A428ZBX3_KIBAR|nr:SDR family oxidoreductase [Kibdelosporangium aridum]RSM85555.1 SDR family NAD(P)-dependent oxidoreductase [Kibdelosporangium aridum]
MSFTLKDSGIVITGAGRGIGAALARRFSAEGARLVLADVDDAVSTVASELDATAVVGDAASEEGVARLVDAARSALGEIDMFCANAGIAPMGGADASEEDWARTWDINVMAHVRAARALLPEWLERGRGHFLATVSAAGLLTSLGSASYSVTKHGALAFAEWLLATYKHRGISVQAICPQGVRTQMLEETGPGGKFLMGDSAITAEQVVDTVVRALGGDSFLILPHPEVAEYYAARATQNDRWIGGMNKLQRKLEEL